MSEQRYARDMAFAHQILGTLPENASCVDAGAHSGEWLTYFTRYAPKGRHAAFEPLPFLAAGLRDSFPQCEIFEMALADESGAAEFQHVVNDAAWSGLRTQQRYFVEPVFEKITVKVERLDDVITTRRVDFIKIDVEGGEFDVLKGARRILNAHRPWIYFEHAIIHFANYGDTSGPLHDLLTEAEYRVLSIERQQVVSRAEFVEVVQRSDAMRYVFPAETNFVAVHNSRSVEGL